MDDKVNCSKCGQPAAGMMIQALSSGSVARQTKCASCAAAEHASTIHTIEEADHFIDDATRQLQTLEALISKQPKMPDVPKGAEAFTMTPLTVYRTLQIHLAAFKSRRMELVTTSGSKEMLNYEIRKAIETEDYERAAKLRSRLEDQPE